MNTTSLNKMLMLTGAVLLVIAMFANIQLYQTLATGLTDKLTWGVMAFVFDCIKILMVVSAGVCWAIEKPFAALLSLIFWVLLTALSLSTLFGYTSAVTQESEHKAAIESMAFKASQSNLESAQQKIDSLAQYASMDIAAVKTQFDSLTAKKASLENELKSCPAGYITKCVKPTQARISQVDSEMAPLRSKLEGYSAFQAANQSKQLALNDAKTAMTSGGSSESLHPMFVNGSLLLSKAFDMQITGNELKVYFLAISATLAELLASFCLWLVSVLGGRSFHHATVQPVVTSNEPVTRNELRTEPVIHNELPTPKVDKPIGFTAAIEKAANSLRVTSYGTTTCAHCGNEFQKNTKNHKFCSTQCRMDANGFVPYGKKA